MQKLKCSVITDYKTFYTSLSKEELEKRRSNLKKQYLLPILAWIVTISIFLLTGTEVELLIILSGTIIGTFIMLYDNYRRRVLYIDQLLDKE